MAQAEIEVDLQSASKEAGLPSLQDFERWVSAAVRGRSDKSEITIRLVDEAEGRALNHKYRGRDYATNVLSFGADLPPEIDLQLLGDLVICAPVVRAEASQQKKQIGHHWAHLCVHGVLHLSGMDHESDADANEMESAEVDILATLGIPDPY